MLPGGGGGRVYPRVCGGTKIPVAKSAGVGGLSPRVRGNRRAALSGAGAVGSIPACAGEPNAGGTAPGSVAVYPRVCGGTAWSESP